MIKVPKYRQWYQCFKLIIMAKHFKYWVDIPIFFKVLSTQRDYKTNTTKGSWGEKRREPSSSFRFLTRFNKFLVRFSTYLPDTVHSSVWLRSHHESPRRVPPSEDPDKGTFWELLVLLGGSLSHQYRLLCQAGSLQMLVPNRLNLGNSLVKWQSL